MCRKACIKSQKACLKNVSKIIFGVNCYSTMATNPTTNSVIMSLNKQITYSLEKLALEFYINVRDLFSKIATSSVLVPIRKTRI